MEASVGGDRPKNVPKKILLGLQSVADILSKERLELFCFMKRYPTSNWQTN